MVATAQSDKVGITIISQRAPADPGPLGHRHVAYRRQIELGGEHLMRRAQAVTVSCILTKLIHHVGVIGQAFFPTFPEIGVFRWAAVRLAERRGRGLPKGPQTV